MSSIPYAATTEDRQHFCTYDQAIAAIPAELRFKSNGEKHIAVNITTGHRIPCADAYMASGYVAGSTALFPHWVYVIEMGIERIKAFEAHPNFPERLKNPNWELDEERERNDALSSQALNRYVHDSYDYADLTAY